MLREEVVAVNGKYLVGQIEEGKAKLFKISGQSIIYSLLTDLV